MPNTIQFLFILEEILKEKTGTTFYTDFRVIPQEDLDEFIQYVLKGFPDFEFNIDIYNCLRTNQKIYEDWKMRLLSTPETQTLYQLKDLITQAFYWKNSGWKPDYFTWETSKPTHTSCKQVKSELKQVKSELKQVKSELKQVKSELKQVMAELKQVRAELQVEPKVRPEANRLTKSQVLEGEDLPPSNYKLVVQILRSVSSRNTFIRARKRVALCLLYLSGLNISKLCRLKVADLKDLLQIGSAAELLAQGARPTESETLLATLREELNILIANFPPEAPAFRNFKSDKPFSRAAFTNELNQLLSPWKLNTKLMRID